MRTPSVADVSPAVPKTDSGVEKPVLSRSNQSGPAIAAKITRMIASAAATGSGPRFHCAM